MSSLKNLGRVLKIAAIVLSIFIAVMVILNIGPPLWKKKITYPILEKERADLWKRYKKPPSLIPQTSYQGLMHSHSYRSHDSGGTLPEILDAAKEAKLDFIFLSDHPHGKIDSFPRGYHGFYDDLIIENGTESSNGLMVQPFDSVILDWNLPFDTLIHQVVSNGGLVTYVHTEKPHPWKNPDYQAMEIYNIHTDLLDEEGILPFFLNALITGSKFRHWGFRELYDEQTAILANWDSLNLNRRIVGIGAVDAHNNNGFKARYLEDGQVEWRGPNNDLISIKKPNLFDKMLLGDPDKYGWNFKWAMDPYFNSFNFVNNHVFCDTFSNINIKENIIKGHVLVAFESLAPAKGFQYFSVNEKVGISAIVGDSVAVADANQLKAVSPFPVKFQLFLNGKLIDESEESYQYNFDINHQKGNYRLVASLPFDNKWTTWVLTNPIYIY